MKKREPDNINNIFQFWKYKCFLFIFLFALCLVFFAGKITTHFNARKSDINVILHEYLSSSFFSNLNNLYAYNVDQTMEEFMDSNAVTSFFFCSKQYPPSEELLSYLTENLTKMTDQADYITAAAIYASTSNTCVSSNTGKINEIELNDLLNDMIYSYNSNSLDKNKLSSDGFNTFLFKYQDYIVFSKDLTTLSGSSYATMFFLMNLEAFSSFVYNANGLIPYKVSIYDFHNNLLFSNSKRSAKDNYAQLLTYTTEGSDSIKTNQSNYIYCRSDMMGLQFLLEMELIPLPGEAKTSPLLYASLLATALFLSIIVGILLYSICRMPAAKLHQIIDRLQIKSTSSVSDLPGIAEHKISMLAAENSTLKSIINVTSSEAVSHLFAKIITGETIEKDETQITLNNTGYGFQLDDIYIAGVLHQTVTDYITATSHYKILNMLNSVFEKFKEKNECNLCAFLFDEKSFVIIASFPSGTSIAKGKTKINELTQQINEGILFLKVPMAVSFGHMYNSILDLSFSYNEAFKAMHYQIEAASAGTFNIFTAPQSHFPPTSQPDTVPAADYTDKQEKYITAIENTEADSSETPDIDRRAAQIAQLIWESREEGLPSLIDRTMTIIFDSGTLSDQEECSKRLVSAVTSHMLSYPFVNDSHLSNVYDDLSNLIHNGTTSKELSGHLSNALDTLCQDFSETLKKQRNPYITAAQDYIIQNYSNPDLSLEEIAEYLKIAPNYLSTIFSKNLGIKLFEHINEYRLEKSIDLLLHTDKTVNDISTECGFGSSRNYIRVFKKYKNNTPGAYRKQHMTQI